MLACDYFANVYIEVQDSCRAYAIGFAEQLIVEVVQCVCDILFSENPSDGIFSPFFRSFYVLSELHVVVHVHSLHEV